MGLQPDTWVALFTFVLAISTIGLWIATDANAKAAFRAAKIAERALTELESPYIFVKFEESGFEIEFNEIGKRPDGSGIHESKVKTKGSLALEFTNYGRSVAVLMGRKGRFETIPKARFGEEQRFPKPIGDTDKENVFEFGAITTNGVPFKVHEWPSFGLKKKPQNIDITQEVIFYIGTLRYEDVLGGVYVLGYCAALDDMFATLDFVGGADHNFLRVEREPGQSLQPSWLQRSRANR